MQGRIFGRKGGKVERRRRGAREKLTTMPDSECTRRRKRDWRASELKPPCPPPQVRGASAPCPAHVQVVFHATRSGSLQALFSSVPPPPTLHGRLPFPDPRHSLRTDSPLHLIPTLKTASKTPTRLTRTWTKPPRMPLTAKRTR
jgi:hypothetical protein